MNTEFKKILEETGSPNVANFYYDRVTKKWMITYQNGIKADEFESFKSAFDFLYNEGKG